MKLVDVGTDTHDLCMASVSPVLVSRKEIDSHVTDVTDATDAIDKFESMV